MKEAQEKESGKLSSEEKLAYIRAGFRVRNGVELSNQVLEKLSTEQLQFYMDIAKKELETLDDRLKDVSLSSNRVAAPTNRPAAEIGRVGEASEAKPQAAKSTSSSTKLTLTNWRKQLGYKKKVSTKLLQFVLTLIVGGIFVATFNYAGTQLLGALSGSLFLGVLGNILSVAIFVSWIVELIFTTSNKATLLDIIFSTKKGRTAFWLVFATLLVLAIYVPQNWGSWMRANTKTVSPQVATLKARYDSLNAQYTTCSADIEAKDRTVDVTNQNAVNAFNAELAACKAIGDEINKISDEYNALTGQ